MDRPVKRDVTRSGLLLAVAAILAGVAALFVVLGTVFNVLLVAVALPFGVAAYFLWSHATGRLQGRLRHRVNRGSVDGHGTAPHASAGQRTAAAGRKDRWPPTGEPEPSMDRADALAALDLAPGVDQPTIRRAYRDRVKTVHPDAEGGDEDEFRRVRAAYERLQAGERGKG